VFICVVKINHACEFARVLSINHLIIWVKIINANSFVERFADTLKYATNYFLMKSTEIHEIIWNWLLNYIPAGTGSALTGLSFCLLML
jgi:hypothetical protein